MVGKGLEARPRLFSQKPHDRGGGRVGRVFLIAAVLQHHAAAHDRLVDRVAFFRIIRVKRMGVVGRKHKALRQPAQILLMRKPQTVCDSFQRVPEKRRCGALLCHGAGFFVVKHRMNGDAVRLSALQEAAQG